MLGIVILTIAVIALFLSFFIGAFLDTSFFISYSISLVLLGVLGKFYNDSKNTKNSSNNNETEQSNNSSNTSEDNSDLELKERIKENRDFLRELESDYDKYSFRVVGVTKENDIGSSIPKLLEKYLEEHMLKTGGERYDSMTNKEIEEWDIEVFEYQPATTYFELEPEPNNTYDKDAIKIVHNKIGHVGYVPTDKTKEVKELLANDPLIKGVIRGGNFKYLDYETGKVEKDFINYNIVVEILC